MKTLTSTLAGAILLSTGSIAAASTLYVANNGSDIFPCGAVTSACRSITFAIQQATAGDTILVKPGRYGDLDGDGALQSLGEETGSPIPTSQGAVYVDKQLTILSTAGAEATIIDIGGAKQAVVELAANGVRFGEKNQGFTLRGSQGYGLLSDGRNGLTIAGNIAHDAPFFGFLVNATGPGTELRHNTAFGNGSGFYVTGWDASSVVTVSANAAIDNLSGITTGGIAAHRIVANQVSGNEYTGLAVNWGPAKFSRNQVTGNGSGASVNGYSNIPLAHGPVFTRNNFVGNRRNGVDVIQGPQGVAVQIRENNIFGNGNCGTTNQTDAPLDARNNFWGVPTGPAFQDPADEACPGAQPTLTTPFATTEFDVR